MTTRRIDPTLYVQAADAFDAVAESADSIGSTARSALSGFSSMAGSYSGGEQFADAYDDLAGAALQNIFDIGVRANSLDRLFTASGANAASAEAVASGQPFDAGAFTLRPARAPRSVAPPPSAYGGTGDEPKGWDLVMEFLTMMWPDADTDKLDGAAQAWKDAAGDVRRLATDVRQGDNPVASLDSAELAKARSEVSDFASDIIAVADYLEEVGTQCSDYADDVREAHKEVIEMLVQLAIEIAATVAISAALTAFTFGGSAVAGAAAAAARIAATVARIAPVLARVAATAVRAGSRIRSVRASLMVFAARHQRSVKVAIDLASGTAAAVLAEGVVQRGDANLLAAAGGSLVGGSITHAIARPFGRYGERVAVKALANAGGGAGGAAAGGLISDGTIDPRAVAIGAAGGVVTAGGGTRRGSGRNSETSAADPGRGNVNVNQEVPVVAGGRGDGAANPDGGRTGSTDYDGPQVSGGNDVSGSNPDGGRTGSTDYDGPQVSGGNDVSAGGSSNGTGGGTRPSEVAPPPANNGTGGSSNGTGGTRPTEVAPPPANNGTGGSSNGTGGGRGPDSPAGDDTPLFHDTETDLGVDVDGDGHVGAPPADADPAPANSPDGPDDTPLFHDTEAATGLDVDGDGVAGHPGADAADATPVGTDADAVPAGTEPDGTPTAADPPGGLPQERVDQLDGSAPLTDDTGRDLSQVLDQSTLSPQQLADYLQTADPDGYADFLRTGEWPSDVQIPRDAGVLAAGPDGPEIDWKQVPHGGYELDGAGNPIMHTEIPAQGTFIDRYGPGNGRYTSPVPDGRPFDYDQRSLPYVEDPGQYHRYEVTGDFGDLRSAYDAAPPDVKKAVDKLINLGYFDWNKLPQAGNAAPGFGQRGGAVQYELPLSVDILVGLGVLREV